MSKFSILGLLALAVPAVQAGTISYSASIGCDSTCVTAYVSWQDFDPGVAFVLVTDNFGDPLFTLSTDFPPEMTGQIDPDPQTITGLTQDQITLIEAGESGVMGDVVRSLVQPDEEPTYADLVLEDQDYDMLGEVVFTNGVPEPATWLLTLLSLGLLSALVLIRRRKLEAAPATK